MNIFIGEDITSKKSEDTSHNQVLAPASTETPVQVEPISSQSNTVVTLIPALAANLLEGETLVLKVTKTPEGVILLAVPPAPDAEDECHAKAAELRSLLAQPLYVKGTPKQAEAELTAMLQGQVDRPQLVNRYVSLKEALILADKAEAEAKKVEQNAKQRSKTTRSKKPATQKDTDSKAETNTKEASKPSEKGIQMVDMFSEGNNKGEIK